MRAVLAMLRKEWRTEIRAAAGLFTAAVFAATCVMAIAAATFTTDLRGDTAAGLLWVCLLFSAAVGIPRRFLGEEESGTALLLRLMVPEEAVYWGKWLFSFAETVAFSAIVSTLFLLLTSMSVPNPGLFGVGMLGSALSLSGTTTLCSAIAAESKNRSGLAATLALPLLVPVIFFGIAALRVALGAEVLGPRTLDEAWRAGWGLVGYGIASVAIGPTFFAIVWKR
ncbi:MAG: heme exporter protein CcmB [Fimbriimonadaceae bacterium]|nr:heme exporter protein CcmB [Fimbriimonadaceae bacterium]